MLDETEIHPLFYGAPSTTEFKKMRKRIVRQVRQAIEQYGMIARDAKWLVCLSGGKDSYTLLAVLYELKWRGLLPVELIACNLDQGQPNFPATVLPEFLAKMGVPHRIEYQDTYSIVMDKIRRGGRSARCVRVCGAVTCTVSRARKAVRRSFWAITATTFWKPSS